MKRKLLYMFILLMGLLISNSSRLSHANQNIMTIKVATFPKGASLSLDGVVIGNTPQTVSIEKGIHHFEFSLPGFLTNITDQTIDETTQSVFIGLDSGPDLIPVMDDPVSISWDMRSDRLRYFSRRSNDFVILDIDSKISGKSAFPFGFLEDAAMRNRLKIPLKNRTNISAVAFQSPSGRYIGYVPERTLTILDTRTSKTINTNVILEEYVDNLSNPPFSLVWAQDENTVWIQRFPSANTFIFFDGHQAKEVVLNNFQTADGKPVYLDAVLDIPAQQRYILVQARQETKLPQMWLVDLSTMRGVVIPGDGILDVIFNAKEDTIYVAHHAGITSYDLQLTKSKLISDVISARWGVYQVQFSKTLNYAFVAAGSSEAPGFWIYRMPK